MTKGIDIYSALSDSRGLSQLVKQVNEITVVVYVYYDAVWCAVLRDYLTMRLLFSAYLTKSIKMMLYNYLFNGQNAQSALLIILSDLCWMMIR